MIATGKKEWIEKGRCSVVRDGTKVKVKAKGLPASSIGRELPDCAAGMRKKHEETDEAR